MRTNDEDWGALRSTEEHWGSSDEHWEFLNMILTGPQFGKVCNGTWKSWRERQEKGLVSWNWGWEQKRTMLYLAQVIRLVREKWGKMRNSLRNSQFSVRIPHQLLIAPNWASLLLITPNWASLLLIGPHMTSLVRLGLIGPHHRDFFFFLLLSCSS